ncbi:MAG: glycosyltransferase family 2 protein [Flavobacteriaceae bacterium]|nr:glycosyltransferase family 2 protein [Flavobacteriaceae bacterium]
MINNNNILINILTRSSNRPVGFQKCYKSVKNQTYKNVRHIVSYDDEKDLVYLKELDIDLVFVHKDKNSINTNEVDSDGNLKAPYNLYCNKLLDTVDEGWILFLDDDDNLYHNKVLEEIVSIIKKEDEDTLFIWQMRYPNGKVLPSNQLIKNKKIVKFNIGSPCFLFHSKYKNKARWDDYKVSDFRFLNTLSNQIPNKIFLTKIVAQINNYGDLGSRNDVLVKSSKIVGHFFNKTLFWYFIPKKHFELFGMNIFQSKTYNELINKIKNKLNF